MLYWISHRAKKSTVDRDRTSVWLIKDMMYRYNGGTFNYRYFLLSCIFLTATCMLRWASWCSNALKSHRQPLKKGYMQVFSVFLYCSWHRKIWSCNLCHTLFFLNSAILFVEHIVLYNKNCLQSMLAPVSALGRWTCESSTSIKAVRMPDASQGSETYLLSSYFFKALSTVLFFAPTRP